MTSGASVAAAQRKVARHLQKADESYDRRRLHIKTSKEQFINVDLSRETQGLIKHMSARGHIDCQVQDMWGGLRTPRLTVGSAYYLRILPTFVYNFYSAAAQNHFLYR